MDTVGNSNTQNQSMASNQIIRTDSYFDGNTWQLIGYRILSALVNTITLGIAYPWMLCMVQRWEVKHTVIHGRRLKFNGHGHQLIGKYLLWVFLTIITFGIYGIWLGLGMKKWVVKHTVYADEEQPVDSYFSGGAGGYLGIHILALILTLFTLGIGKAWADKMVLKWEAKHTHIGGSPLEFNGTGGQLFVKYLLLALLTPLTLGIYALFFTVIYMKWQVKHTEAVYQTPEIQAKAKAHEMTAVQDFAKYRIAANDQEIAAMKSGYTGKEDAATLERLAEENNPFAAYHLAKQLKGESALYEGRALELLQKSADGKYHPALLDLAKQLPSEQMVSMLTDAAQCGNAEASWLLALEYQIAANLAQAAYWFKVALEWGVADAKARTTEYDELVKNIALQLSENREMPKQSKALPIVLGVVGAVVLLVVVALLLGVRVFKFGSAKEEVAVTVGNVEGGWIIQDVHIMQSRHIDDIRGDENDSSDYLGNTIHYILDENIFFDYEEKMLYFEFGVIEYDFPICLTDKVEWKTEEITDSGIFQVSYPYDTPPEKIAVMGETFISSDDTVNIIYGTTAEAEEWLEEKYSFDDQTDKPATDNTETPTTPPTSTVPEVNIAESIVGEWEFYDMYTHISTGDTTLEIWRYTFNADGTYSSSHEECIESPNGNGTYYANAYWMTMLGSGQDGSYKLIDVGNDVVLSMDYYIDGENGILTTLECYIDLDDDVLSLRGDGWSRTLTKVK